MLKKVDAVHVIFSFGNQKRLSKRKTDIISIGAHDSDYKEVLHSMCRLAIWQSLLILSVILHCLVAFTSHSL